MLGRGFHTLIKNAPFPFATDVGSHNSPPLQDLASSLALVHLSDRCEISQFTPLQGLASSLAHRPVSGSDTICNSPSPLLAYIVIFGLSLQIFKMRLLGRGFHTLKKKALFPSPTDVGSHYVSGNIRTHIFPPCRTFHVVTFCPIRFV